MKVAIIGAGIAGLAAAIRLTELGVTETHVYEAEDRAGGKVRGSRLGNGHLDEGPDAFLVRVPEALELAEKVGLGDSLVHPSARRALIYRRGALYPLPNDLVLGAPTSRGAVLRNRALTPLERAYVSLKLTLPIALPPESDDLGQLARRRYSRAYVDHVLDPLIGGINAGSIYGASARILGPQVESLMRGKSKSSPTSSSSLPVFAAPRDGMWSLPQACQRWLENAGGTLLLKNAVTAVSLGSRGWTVSSANGSDTFDGIIIATPAFESARLLQATSRAGAGILSHITYNSVSVVTLTLQNPISSIGDEFSGVLVPSSSGLLTSAITLASHKWPHWVGQGNSLLRISTGRTHDRRHLRVTDETLVGILRGEAEEILGQPLTVVNHRVSRYEDSFPSFPAHHTSLMRNLRQELSSGSLPPIALAGAYLYGSGIPSCIRSGTDSANALVRVD